MKIKIQENELDRINQNPLELFYQGIKAETTREKYTRTLKRVVSEILEDILHGSFEERVTELVQRSKIHPDWAQYFDYYLKKTKRKNNFVL